jgi:aminopeptidase N
MRSKLLFILFIFFKIIAISAQQKQTTDWYQDYDVKWYKIDIKVSDTIALVSGSTKILSEIKSITLDTFCFELSKQLIIDSVVTNKLKCNYSREGDLVLVSLNSTVKSGTLLDVDIYYRGKNGDSFFFSSFSSRKDTEWDIPVTWTLSEPFGAKTWFPCKQLLSDKADSSTIMITVDKHLKAGSNGILQSVIPMDSNKVKYVWKTKYPVAYYLLSFTVADYSEYSFYATVNEHDSVLVQNYYYNRPGYFEKNKTGMENTAKFIQLFSRLFGDYPFKNEKYGHCVAPMGGGMEHQTMTTLSGFGYDLVSHELSHQWFGDLVTCSDWRNIWINEGFASYSEYLAIGNLKSKDEAIDWMENTFKYSFYYPKGSLYVPKEYENDELRIFSMGLSYKKGAAIIQALRNEINNDSLFFSVLKQFLKTYSYRSASADDFLMVLNDVTGSDYKWFLDQWFYGKGFPEVDIFWNQTNDSIKVYSVQKNSSFTNQAFKFHYDFKISNSGNETIVKRVYQDAWSQMFTFPCSFGNSKLEVNPDYKSYFKLNNFNTSVDLPTMDNIIQLEKTTFKDSLQIKFNQMIGNSKLFFTDLKGNPVLERKVKKQSSMVINTSFFDSGFYLLNLVCDNKKYVRIVYKK